MRESHPGPGLGLGRWASCPLGVSWAPLPFAPYSGPFSRCTSLVSRGREPGETASWWGLLPCGGLVEFRHAWHLEEAACRRGRGRSRGQGPGRSVCGMVGGTASPGPLRRSLEGLGARPPPGREGGVCFSLSPLWLVCSWTWEVLSVLSGGCLS